MLKSLMKKIGGSATYWQSLANYAERGWGLLYSVILARLILPEEFGIYALGTSIAVIASLLTRWEIGNLIRVDPYYQKKGFGSAWAMTKFLTYVEILVITLVSVGCLLWGVSVEVCAVIFLYGFFSAIDKFSNLLRCDLEGKMKFKQNFKLKMVFTPTIAILTIPLALMGFGVWALIGTVWVAPLVHWVVMRNYNRRSLTKHRVSLSSFREIIRPGFWPWLCYCTQMVYVRVDKITVGAVGTKADVGYYNRSYNYAPLSFLALGALAGGPAIVIFSKTKEISLLWKIYRKRAAILLSSGVLFGVMWLLWADILVVFLFGSKWISAVPYFEAFAMFGAVQGIYHLTCSLMQGRKLFKSQAVINLLVIIVAVSCGLLFVRNAIGIVYLVQITMLVSTMLMLYYVFVHAEKHQKV